MARRLLVAVAIATSCVQSTTSTTTPAAPSRLDELVERAGRMKSLHATFQVVSSSDPPWTVVVDYQSPDRIRVEERSTDESTTSWVGGPLFTARLHDATHDGHARVDLQDVIAAFSPVDEALAAFGAELREDADDFNPGWTVGLAFDWSYDSARDEGVFSVTANSTHAKPSSKAFAWLETLRRKNVEPSVVGDDLVFTTDEGHVTATVSPDGLLRRLVARTGSGTTTVELQQAEVDAAIPPARLEPAADADEGADVSADFRQMALEGFWKDLRARSHAAIGRAGDVESLDASRRAKAESLLRTLHEVGLSERLRDETILIDAWLDRLVGFVTHSREAGASSEDVDSELHDAKGELLARLDALERQEAARTETAPETSLPAGHAAALLHFEQRIATQVFRDVVRAPRLGRLEQLESKNASTDR